MVQQSLYNFLRKTYATNIYIYICVCVCVCVGRSFKVKNLKEFTMESKALYICLKLYIVVYSQQKRERENIHKNLHDEACELYLTNKFLTRCI